MEQLKEQLDRSLDGQETILKASVLNILNVFYVHGLFHGTTSLDGQNIMVNLRFKCSTPTS